MLSIRCLEKSLIWCLFPINVFESKLDGSVFRVICRLYTEMRCDYVNYGYFLYLLDRLKFGESRKWVWISILTIRFSIMVNRTTIFFSNRSRGLRQWKSIIWCYARLWRVGTWLHFKLKEKVKGLWKALLFCLLMIQRYLWCKFWSTWLYLMFSFSVWKQSKN